MSNRIYLICLVVLSGLLNGILTNAAVPSFAGELPHRKYSENIDSLKSPIGASMRSFFIPGWGQWYNDKKIKSVGTFLVEGSVIYLAVHENNKYNRYGDEKFLKRRNTIYWWGFFLHLATIMDAYVDAYLDRFNEDMNITFEGDGRVWALTCRIAL